MSTEQQKLKEIGYRDSLNSTCVVCFRYFKIFSIGECDHPVCYECSTRMRVLCQQNECPICRQGLSKVIFTNEKQTYRELEAKNRSEYYNKKYKICFSNIEIQKTFYDLLEHPCPKCEARKFNTFDALRDHVRKDHELFYCDICTENLKIFSFERRCYNRQELGLHRRKGDPDNTSHKGHPMCQFCDLRFLDRDELFRHLRREHYYCHFCDADGANQFYGTADSMRDHFRAEHFICEEGECARDQISTSVFRTDIDLRAHITSVHGKTMGKLQAKQARTLQLEITLGPRGRSNQEQTSAHLRSRGNNDYEEIESMYTQPVPVQNAPMIDARNEQEFPSLSGPGSSSAVSVVHPNMSIRTKTFGPAGLARTKENFPALGNGWSSSSDTGPSGPANSKPIHPVSAIIKNPKISQQKPNNGSSMVIHVSNRPNTNANSINLRKVPNQKDFPALPISSRSQNNIRREEPALRSMMDYNISKGHQNPKQASIQKENAKPPKKAQEFYVAPNPNINLVSAKHRSLVDDYVSILQPNPKLALVEKESVKPSKKSPDYIAPVPDLNTNDFPALAAGSTPNESSWIKIQRQPDRENRKSKVAQAPFGNGPDYDSLNFRKYPDKKELKKKNSDTENNNQKDKKQSKTNERKLNNDLKKNENTGKSNDTKQNTKQSKKKNTPDNNNETKVTNKNTNIPKEKVNFMGDFNNKADFPTLRNSSASSVPPGFDSRMNEIKSAPPGFKSVTLNSVAKPTNNMTFTNSLGENYTIIPTHQYTPPPNSSIRNKELVKIFQEVLVSPEAVAEFRFISQKFREGVYKTNAYFEHCKAALKDLFDDIFPELLVLLPDISKQQDLYLVYSQYLNSLFATSKQLKAKALLSVCKKCKQIVINDDLLSHVQTHNLESNFPVLNESNGVITSAYRN